jgi:hypothetical protein
MSLLMKALEKAAKDRVDARTEPAAVSAAPAPAKAELSLEPIASDTSPTSASPRGAGIASGISGASSTRTGAATVPPREPAQLQASTVMQAAEASRTPEGGVVEYLRTHPLLVLGLLAALFATGFGIYVYLQIARPGVSIGQPPLASKTPPRPPVEAPSPPVAPARAALSEPVPAAVVLK